MPDLSANAAPSGQIRRHRAEGRVLVTLGDLLPRLDAQLARGHHPGGRSAYIYTILERALSAAEQEHAK